MIITLHCVSHITTVRSVLHLVKPAIVEIILASLVLVSVLVVVPINLVLVTTTSSIVLTFLASLASHEKVDLFLKDVPFF